MPKIPTHNEIQQQINKLNEMTMDNWIYNFVFSLKWWTLLVLSIVPWFLWWKIVDKSRITEILLYGFFIISVSTILEVIGWNYSLWFYPDTLLGLCTPLMPMDYTLLPIFYMLAYQYFSSWKSFSIALLILSFTFAFVLEPLAEMLNFYKTLKWNYVYSFFGYFLIGVFSRGVVLKIIKIQKEVNR
ncbi:CBO0543 family protein [Peribacillus frigoritolerans]|uniref:CBO0543 family protein n=1 Tax=Peribacillus frigoritolerans TaxID=450367 RepID=UPI00399FA09E